MSGTQASAGDGQGAQELAVLRYLRKRGYVAAEAALRSECKLSSHVSAAQLPDPVASSGQVAPVAAPPAAAEYSGSVLTNQILFYSVEEAHPRRYFTSYERLREWVYNSLDLYKNELSRVLYPVMVHCFLDLVEKNELVIAREFLDAFRKEHERLHGSEINSLQGLGDSEHLKSNDTAQLFRKHRFCLKLCSYSFDLLVRFLHEQDFMLLLSILNERVAFQVDPGRPDQLADGEEEEEEDVGVITGHEAAQQRAMNAAPGRWGMLQDSLEGVVERERTAAKALEAEAALMPAKKAKKELAKPTATKEPDSLEATALTVPTMIPIPKLAEHTELQVLEDLRRRVALSSSSLPSVCFFTVHHASSLLNCTTVSADSRIVVGGMGNSSIRVWDMDKEAAAHKHNAKPPMESGGDVGGDGARKRSSLNLAALPSMHLGGHSGPVYAVHLAPDNQHLLSASGDRTVRLWNLELQANLVSYRSHNFPVWDVKFGPLGYYFASASHDRTARIWAMDRTDPLRVLVGHLSDVDTVAWHPNCNYIATGSSDKTVRLWDVQTGEGVRLYTGHHSTVYSLAMSPDGRTMASGSDDGTVIVWDLASNKRLGTLTGHNGPVWNLDYSGGGNMLASGGADCSVRLWDINTAAESDSLEVANTSSTAETNSAGDAKPEKLRFGHCLKTLGTKNTPVYTVKFTRRNLLLASGPKQ